MAGRGPAPKQAPLSRANDEARKRASITELTADGVVRGPDLPADVAWHPRTAAWWQTWRLSAVAQRFTGTDWDFLLDTAILHTQFWSGDPAVGAELRLRVSKFGATIEDRMRLRVEAAGDGSAQVAKKPAAKDRASSARRRRLLKAVGDD